MHGCPGGRLARRRRGGRGSTSSTSRTALSGATLEPCSARCEARGPTGMRTRRKPSPTAPWRCWSSTSCPRWAFRRSFAPTRARGMARLADALYGASERRARPCRRHRHERQDDDHADDRRNLTPRRALRNRRNRRRRSARDQAARLPRRSRPSCTARCARCSMPATRLAMEASSTRSRSTASRHVRSPPSASPTSRGTTSIFTATRRATSPRRRGSSTGAARAPERGRSLGRRRRPSCVSASMPRMPTCAATPHAPR